MLEIVADALALFLREVCARFGGQTLPGRAWDSIIREGEGHWRFEREPRPDFLRFVSHVSEHLAALPSFTTLWGRISVDPTLATRLLSGQDGFPLADEAGRRQRLRSAVIGPFLERYFDHDTAGGRLYAAQGLRFDASSFDATLQEADADLQAARGPMVTLMTTTPLVHLHLDAGMDTLVVAPGIVLRRVTLADIERWYNSPYFVQGRSGVDTSELLGLACVIEARLQDTPHPPLALSGTLPGLLPDGMIWMVKERLLTAIRLLTGALIFESFTLHTTRDLLNDQEGVSWGLSPLRQRGRPVTLDPAQGDALRTLWPQLGASPNIAMAGLALRRWEGAMDRLQPADQLVDYWIALESLFTPDSTAELKFRASLRIAAFLGRNAAEREEIYEALRSSYDCRSSIVHGSTSKKLSKYDVPGLTSTIGAYVNRVLRKILAASHPFDPTAIEGGLLRAAGMDDE